MGLTIHYELKAPDRPMERIRELHRRALEMDFEEVSGVFHLVGDACEAERYGNDEESPVFWLLIQAGLSVEISEDRSLHTEPLEVIAFSTWPGEGCEDANLGLCRYPPAVEFSGRPYPTGKGEGWHWSSFCKTQYANRYGLQHFLRCHKLPIRLLGEAKEIGILSYVGDEGGYWEKRSDEDLVREIGEWDAWIAYQGKVLKDHMEASGYDRDVLRTQMEGRMDLERLEAEGTERRGQLSLFSGVS